MRQKFNEYPGNWQLLGEIELPEDADINDRIYTWLVETLKPLDLNDRFLSKIFTSAQLSVGSEPSTILETAHKHIHFRIYTPEDNPSNGQSWGFFRVEKKSDLQFAETKPGHSFVFYLYREGI